MRLHLLLMCLIAASPALAGGFTCVGEDPRWTLEFDAAQGRFAFPTPTEMDVMLETRVASGEDWPRAYTLVGARDTAIALIEREACRDAPYRAHVFTQRGQTPLLLGGCCQASE